MSHHTVTIIDQPTAATRQATDLSIEGREGPKGRRVSRARALTVATVVPLLALSFALGRVSNNAPTVKHAQTGQTATAGLSPQAARQAQARLVLGNGAELSGSGQTTAAGRLPQAQRQAQARLVQGNGTEVVSDSGPNPLSFCRPQLPC